MELQQWEKDLGITANRFDNHDEYYLQLASKFGIRWTDETFMGKTIEQWTELHNEDEHLNNHPLSAFDRYYPYHRAVADRKHIPFSMSMTVCMLKAVIKEKIK